MECEGCLGTGSHIDLRGLVVRCLWCRGRGTVACPDCGAHDSCDCESERLRVYRRQLAAAWASSMRAGMEVTDGDQDLMDVGGWRMYVPAALVRVGLAIDSNDDRWRVVRAPDDPLARNLHAAFGSLALARRQQQAFSAPARALKTDRKGTSHE